MPVVSHAPEVKASRIFGGRLTGTVSRPAWQVPATRSTANSVAGSRSASSISAATSAGAAVTHGMPIIPELPKKISANDSPMTTWIPHRCSACGACSREDPQPKLELTSSTAAPWKCFTSKGCRL